MTQLLPLKGVYALVLRVRRPISVKIGKLGRRRFSAGYYVYVGSALNSLPSRVLRHVRKSKRKHWHIDYLTTHTGFTVLSVSWKRTRRHVECKLAQELGHKSAGGEKGFGCQDCSCDTHLYYFRAARSIWNALSRAGLRFLSTKSLFSI